jgi:hypothetical protein
MLGNAQTLTIVLGTKFSPPGSPMKAQLQRLAAGAIIMHGLTASAAGCFPAPAGMVGWWPGEGDASDIASTNNGLLQAGALANAAGEVGSAFSFDGVSTFVQIPDTAALKPATLTIEGWVKFSSLDSSGSGGSPAGSQYIVFKQNTRASSFEGYSLTKTRIGGGDAFSFVVSSSAGASVEVRSPAIISTGTWYHLAAVRGSNFVQIYVNGLLQQQATVGFAQNYGNAPLFFGTTGQAWDHKLAGALDEVTLFNRALSSNEIASIYAASASGKCAGPRIIAQPQSQTVAIGANVQIAVTATSSAPLSFQWQRNGSNLADGGAVSGANTSALGLSSVQTNDSGGFRVVITNSLGAGTSAVAVLTVDAALKAPVISAQPTNQTVVAGASVSFVVNAAGSPPLGFQWRFNGTNLPEGGQISGSATSNLLINYTLPQNSGNYSVVVTNPVGSVTSAVAVLSVNPPTGCLPPLSGMIGWWPGDGSTRDLVGTNNGILQGGAIASAPGVVSSAFNLDGTNGFIQIPNAPELNPTNLTVECWVKFHLMDTPGNSTTGAQYIVFKQNTRNSVFEGFNLSKHRYATDIIVWEVSSAAGVPIQVNGVTSIEKDLWYHCAGVRGSNFVQLYINGQLEVQAGVNFPQDYGNYPLYFGTSNQSSWDHKLGGSVDEVTLYNRALSPAEIAAIYAAGPAGKCKSPIILTQPQGGLRYLGDAITLTATAAGVGTLRCQWLKDNAPIAGGTNFSLVLTNLAVTNAGNYALLVTNALGSAMSSAAVVSLKLADLSISPSGAGPQASAGLTISGVVGQVYGIQSCSNLTTLWQGLTNLTLNASTQVWHDPQPMSLPQRYYRVMSGPISIP